MTIVATQVFDSLMRLKNDCKVVYTQVTLAAHFSTAELS